MPNRRVWVPVVLLSVASVGFTSPALMTQGQQPARAAPLPHTFTTANIEDPTFNNMLAGTMTVPSGWKLEGTILTAPCTTMPWPVYRAYSPDGLTEIRQMPTLGWVWGKQAAGHGNGQP